MQSNENTIIQMKQDMLLRGYSQSTQDNYLRYAKKFLDYTKRPTTELDEQDIKRYLNHLLTEKKLSHGTVNMYNAAVRFLFEVSLIRALNHKQIPRLREIRKLPYILSKEELQDIFSRAASLRDKTILMTLYGGGLRLSEACRLRACDIDSQNMRIFINQSKNNKDRYTLLSQTNLEILREYWLKYRPKHPDGWLFLNKDHSTHINTRTVERSLEIAIERSNVKAQSAQATIHTLRHCFATHLLEDGVDFFTVKQLLGHTGMETTVRYGRCMKLSPSLKSPLDSLSEEHVGKPEHRVMEA